MGLLALALALTLVIVACGDDEPEETAAPAPTAMPATPAPTMAPTPAPTMAPTAAPTMAPTAAATPRPTAAPTMAPTPTMAPQPVSTRLKVSLPPGREQNTIPYAQSQVSEKLMPEYSHLIGRNITTNVEEPQLATEWSRRNRRQDLALPLSERVSPSTGMPSL